VCVCLHRDRRLFSRCVCVWCQLNVCQCHPRCQLSLCLSARFLSCLWSSAKLPRFVLLPFHMHIHMHMNMHVSVQCSAVFVLCGLCISVTIFVESLLSIKQSAVFMLNILRLRNDLYCVGWGVKLYSLTHYA